MATSREPRPLSPALLARYFNTPSLLYFIAVGEGLSIRGASRQLNVASSAIARQIGRLERAVGLPLFDRRARRLSLTPAGQILLKHVRQVTRPIEAAADEINLLRGLKTGNVRIATAESIALAFLPPLIAEFSTQYPGISVDVDVVMLEDIARLVADGQADLGFSFERSRAPAATHRGIGAIVRSDHPLAKRRKIGFEDCLEYRLALPKRGNLIREIVDKAFDMTNRDWPPVVEANSLSTLIELAKTGVFVAILSELMLKNDLPREKLVFVPFATNRLPFSRVCLIGKTDGSLRFAAREFHALAKSMIERLTAN
ncbi:LysR family transcriptional regulator [Mesorhizobium koreense]|uniref:LysR family transcriptional regulator n=1 Tax=Mesorhizobium koreense TaxID=3074855 RepID=UPI00287BC50B|nr:LysR family transcriptional regulator [Mesorhizobium sp. WR6]